ncbi:hypothetical protein L873DRAFT_402325 [Choiromyces venosus 120613-1]|uniref:Tc1-like transposase DDE domain-containing protein n=1 Tax=Choiromyces venosus 120613-1 TaxID=1336337 RepID=A0A3N4J0J6_9PEZI|nr:hypothetical protein L873DRAFT_402325 [Choiromyces venosus 120613-1]
MEQGKDSLVTFVKRNFMTRRMKLVDIWQEAGLSHVCNGTVFNALVECRLEAYREEFKFILSPECKARCLAYCTERRSWEAEKDWGSYAFMDEMSIEIGAVFGLHHVWRETGEKWHNDCVRAKKKQGEAVICWGMVMW